MSDYPKIHYHFNSRFARFVRWLARKPKTSNWLVTIGRHTFVSFNIIGAQSRAHEMCHTLQWQKHGWKFPFKYLNEHRKRGYKRNLFEVAARMFELYHWEDFAPLRKK